eukprot:c20349_g1_i2 orf=349-507(-)
MIGQLFSHTNAMQYSEYMQTSFMHLLALKSKEILSSRRNQIVFDSYILFKDL